MEMNASDVRSKSGIEGKGMFEGELERLVRHAECRFCVLFIFFVC